MSPRVLVVLVVIAVGCGAFWLGRLSGHSTPAKQDSYRTGYLAGREDAFSGYDGGWGYDELYIVELKRGSPEITYRFAKRWPMKPGVAYRACGSRLCTRP